MEYLMTYGWAILVIAVILAALYQLGVFSGTNFITTSCIAESGFVCAQPVMNTSGYVQFYLGQISNGTMTVVGVGCTNNTQQPSSFTSTSTGLTPEQKAQVVTKCPGLAPGKIGSPFRGYVWIKYNFGAQSGLVAQVAVLSITSTTPASFLTPVIIYCVGGAPSPYTDAYYAAVSSGGVGAWTATTSYPVAFYGNDCLASNGYIYCVGGGAANYVYYAPISSSGIGAWAGTSNYPIIGMANNGCSLYGGYLYCVGANGASPYTQVYYAPVSSSGVGSWSAGTSYPTFMYGAGCSASNGYLYCVGAPSAPQTQTYYAPISSTGVGAWTYGGAYPIAMSAAGCSILNGYIYCIGNNQVSPYNQVYYAPISTTGFGTWAATTSYPVGMEWSGCTINNGYIYCVGTQTNPENYVYYAPISTTGIGPWTATTSYPVGFDSAGCTITGDTGGFSSGGGSG